MFVAIPKKSLPALDIHPASLNEEEKRSLMWVVSHHVTQIKDSDELKTLSVEAFAKQVGSRFQFVSHGESLAEKVFYFVINPDGSADGSILSSSPQGALIALASRNKNWTNLKDLNFELERLEKAGFSIKRLTVKLKLDLEITEIL